MKRCELCGGIAWRGRTEVAITDGTDQIEIALNGKECDSIKVCRGCMDALFNLFMIDRNKRVKE